MLKILSTKEYKKLLDSLSASRAGNKKLLEELSRKNIELVNFEQKLDTLKRPLVDPNAGDPAPTKDGHRREYVARVSFFFKEIMEPKLLQMISGVHNELAVITNKFDYQKVLQGTVNAYWNLLEWGQEMDNERVDYETRDENGENKEGVDVKEKLEELIK